ncbi:MAG: 5-formyltetrahydrofolate cyclo-ligase [Clostridiales Family XIII bacterium]|jgi:5-formyltetrahydrofolate cyclo-ligase|nr:5-formyltetrahydrofolate cyclo-ligase [Clostridiales Family XIII bacterium]
MTEKSAFRRKMLEKRASIDPADRSAADLKILYAVTALPEYLAAETIFCYVSAADEPDTRALMEDALTRGKRVCVPLCASMGVMHAHEITGFADLTAGKYDIPEPKPHCPLIPPEAINFIVVPCVCCDRDGYRLGYGGGFYDRWLEKCSAPSAVLCFERMLVPSVPREAHDRRADILVSDEGSRRTQG